MVLLLDQRGDIGYGRLALYLVSWRFGYNEMFWWQAFVDCMERWLHRNVMTDVEHLMT